jgi:Transposase DDE domain group 1
LSVAGQILKIQRTLRQRVWEAAHVTLREVTLDTDTTVHTRFGQQMGTRKAYNNPKNRGKKSHQPILTFLAETREYIGGELRNGDRPTGTQIARHLESVLAALPETVQTVRARADSGFYCWEAIQAYDRKGCQFIVSARKTSRLLEVLRAARWTGSPRTDADGQCEFRYQPEGWEQAYRFLALRYKKEPKADAAEQSEQYQLFDAEGYKYRVFVTNIKGPIDALVWFYNQRAGAENLIKEANNDAGLAAHPSARWAMNCVHSNGDAGVQLQLLADAVQPRRASHGGDSAAHHTGHQPAALLVPGGQDLAACRPGGRQLQRSLRRERYLAALDGSAAGGGQNSNGIRAGDCLRAPLLIERA